MQDNGNLRPPKRPGYGTVGRPIKLRANFFRMNISPRLSDLYHYDVEITPNKCPRMVKRDVVNQIVMKYRSTVFQGHDPAFDGERNLYSSIKLPSPVSESICESTDYYFFAALSCKRCTKCHDCNSWVPHSGKSEWLLILLILTVLYIIIMSFCTGWTWCHTSRWGW